MVKKRACEQLVPLKISTAWINLIVVGETNVVQTFKGYAPVLPVRVKDTGLDYIMYISAKSMTEQLEPLRAGNNGLFSGLEFMIHKTGSDKFSPYEIKVR